MTNPGSYTNQAMNMMQALEGNRTGGTFGGGSDALTEKINGIMQGLQSMGNLTQSPGVELQPMPPLGMQNRQLDYLKALSVQG